MGNFNSNNMPLSSSNQGNIHLRHILRLAVLHHYRDALFVVDYHAIVLWVYYRSQMSTRKVTSRTKWIELLESDRCKHSVEYIAHLRSLQTHIIDQIPLMTNQGASSRASHTPTSCHTPNTQRSSCTDVALLDLDTNSVTLQENTTPIYLTLLANANSVDACNNGPTVPPPMITSPTNSGLNPTLIRARQLQLISAILVVLNKAQGSERSKTFLVTQTTEETFIYKTQRPTTPKEAFKFLLCKAYDDYITTKGVGIGAIFDAPTIEASLVTSVCIQLYQDPSFFVEEVTTLVKENDQAMLLLFTYLSQFEKTYNLTATKGNWKVHEQDQCELVVAELFYKHPEFIPKLTSSWVQNLDESLLNRVNYTAVYAEDSLQPYPPPPPPESLMMLMVDARLTDNPSPSDMEMYRQKYSLKDHPNYKVKVPISIPALSSSFPEHALGRQSLDVGAPREGNFPNAITQYACIENISHTPNKLDELPHAHVPLSPTIFTRHSFDNSSTSIPSIRTDKSIDSEPMNMTAKPPIKRVHSHIWKQRHPQAVQEEIQHNMSCGQQRMKTMDGVNVTIHNGIVHTEEALPERLDLEADKFEVQPHICDSDSEEENQDEYTWFYHDIHSIPHKNVITATLTYPWSEELMDYKRMVKENCRKASDIPIEVEEVHSTTQDSRMHTVNNLDDIPTVASSTSVAEPSGRAKPTLFSCGSLQKSRSEGAKRSVSITPMSNSSKRANSQHSSQHTRHQHPAREVLSEERYPQPSTFVYPSNEVYKKNIPSSFYPDPYMGSLRDESIKYDSAIPGNREHQTLREDMLSSRKASGLSNRSGGVSGSREGMTVPNSSRNRIARTNTTNASSTTYNSTMNNSSRTKYLYPKSQWRDFIHLGLHLTSDKTVEGVALQLRKYTKVLFQLYTRRKKQRHMTEAEFYKLTFDLHTLSVNEGLLMFEFQLLKFMLKLLDRIETSLYVNQRNNCAISGMGSGSTSNNSSRSHSSTPTTPSHSIDDPHRTLKITCRNILRLFHTWCMEQYREEHNTRKAASLRSVQSLAKTAWTTANPGGAEHITEIQFMYNLPDVLELLFPTARFTMAAKQVYLDQESIFLDDDAFTF